MASVVHLEQCPYSDPPFSEFTDDHIFPQFLGGRATIRICRECNSGFGYSFEAESAKQIKRLQVFIAHFGLNLTRTAATWPSALKIGDTSYNLKPGQNGAEYELTHPVIRRDISGNIVAGQCRSKAEAEQLARNLVQKGKAKRVVIEQTPGEILNDISLESSFSFNSSLYRLATKLVANALVYMGHRQLISSSGIARYLHGSAAWASGPAYCDTSQIRNLRPPLSHTIYIEFGNPSHGIVLVFGAMQIYVPLPVASPGAFLGFLDPITGEESFTDMNPISLVPPPAFVSINTAKNYLREMLQWLGEEGKLGGRPVHLIYSYSMLT